MSTIGFTVDIVGGKDKQSSSVNITGSVQHVITDDERVSFNLGDHQLKEAVGKYFGQQPKDAYLHSPTPWDDLYKRYAWPQVQTVVTAESAEILDITSKPVVLKTQTFTNSSSLPATFNVSVTDSVSETMTSNWSTERTVSVSQTIKYEVGFLGTGGGGETSLSYSQSWGKGGAESKRVTLGSSSGISIKLDPGQSVTAKLSASSGVMKVRVRYKAHLIGTTAVNYNPTYKDHHFWAFDIGGVMSAAGVPNSVITTEDIEIDYYSRAKTDLMNNPCGTLRASIIH